MVFLDISSSSDKDHSKCELNIASVSDRLIALLIDFFIFFPIFSLLVSGMIRELRVVSMVGVSADELTLIWFLVAIAVVTLSSVTSALFMHFWKGTPGQRFLHLRVVSLIGQNQFVEDVGFGQGLFRSSLWWFSILLCGLPFLEILSHSQRRAFHERATDTMVVSSKSGDLGPHPLETKFIHSWYRTFSLMFFAILAIIFFRSYQTVKSGLLSKNIYADTTCSDVPKTITDETKRIDAAISLYLAGQTTAECVEGEARIILWSSNQMAKPLAYLGMSLVNPDEAISDQYQDKVCESGASEACSIVLYLDSEESNRADILRKKGLGLLTSRMLLLEQMSQEQNYASAMALIEDLKKEKLIDLYLGKQSVRNMWSLSEKMKNKKGRSPASSEEQELLENFKKEFEIP